MEETNSTQNVVTAPILRPGSMGKYWVLILVVIVVWVLIPVSMSVNYVGYL